MHYNIERHLNNLAPTQALPELKLYLDFERDVMRPRNIEPWRTEWRIADKDRSIGGSVDFVGKLSDGTYALMDWKRSKNLENALYNSYGRKARWPISHIDDNEASKYFLQLNLYRLIIQQHYGLEISLMVLSSFHPQGASYFSLEVPIWEEEAQAVLDEHVQQMEQQMQAPPGIGPIEPALPSSP